MRRECPAKAGARKTCGTAAHSATARKAVECSSPCLRGFSGNRSKHAFLVLEFGVWPPVGHTGTPREYRTLSNWSRYPANHIYLLDHEKNDCGLFPFPLLSRRAQHNANH